MQKIRRNNAIRLIKEIKSKGHSFGVTYIKKNGEERTMLARLGVKPNYEKKIEQAYNPIDYGLLTVLDVNKTRTARKVKKDETLKVYRQVNINTLCRIKYGGVTYFVIGNELDKNAYKSNQKEV